MIFTSSRDGLVGWVICNGSGNLLVEWWEWVICYGSGDLLVGVGDL